MNYRELLKKYMNHVGHEEGVYFIPEPNTFDFDKIEIEELETIRAEIEKE